MSIRCTVSRNVMRQFALREPGAFEAASWILWCSWIYVWYAVWAVESLTRWTGPFGIVNISAPWLLWSQNMKLQIVFNALQEEILWRAPLYFVPRRYLFAAVVVAAAGFGWAHGDMRKILVQGIGGLLFSWLFLKCGGFHGHPVRGILCATLGHYLTTVQLHPHLSFFE